MTKQEIRMAIVVILSVIVGEVLFRVADRAFHRAESPAVATATASTPELGACSEDMQKFCPGTKTGLGGCLFEHLFELQASCREQYPAFFPKLQACWNDIFSLCKDVPPRQNRIPQCLRDNATRVSVECRASPYFEQR